MYKPHIVFQKYILHLLKSNNRHGVHSPFVYDFLDKVLYRSGNENIRNTEGHFDSLKSSRQPIEDVDLGAGPSKPGNGSRTVGDFVRKSAISNKQGRLLHRMVAHYKPSSILELGTNLGKSLAYMASGNSSAKAVSIEGNPDLATMAIENLARLNILNTQVVQGAFEKVLPTVLGQMQTVELAFIDGNHRYAPTMAYLEKILPFLADQGLIVFHDIHYSPEMEKAWKEIISHPRFHVTMDLFFMGIASPRAGQRKEHFNIRF